MKLSHQTLGSILEQSGYDRSGDNDYPVLSITMKKGLVDQSDKFKKRVASQNTSTYRVVYKNELVVGFPIDEGVLGFQTKYPAGIVSPAYDIWKLKNEATVHIPYLERYLRSTQARQLYASKMQGAVARRRSLNKHDFIKLEIPVPLHDDQIRIAHLLSRVEGLIAQRKENLQQLEELLKTVFQEMFGDIRAKKSDHEWEKPRPYLKANSGKCSKQVKSEEKTNFPIYGGNGINGWATEPLYNENVIIAGRVGQQCGVIHVSEGPCWVTDNAIVLRITNTKKLDPIYLAAVFQHAPIREKVKQLDLPFINQSMLLDYSIPMPPIELQGRYASIVKKAKNIETHYQRSLTELVTLYGALSQKAFKGELDLSRIPLPATSVLPQDHRRDAKPVEPTAQPESAGALSIPVPFNSWTFEEFLRLRAGETLTATALWQAVHQEHFTNPPPSFEIFKKWVLNYLEQGRWLEQVYAGVPVNPERTQYEKKIALRVRDDS